MYQQTLFNLVHKINPGNFRRKFAQGRSCLYAKFHWLTSHVSFQSLTVIVLCPLEVGTAVHGFNPHRHRRVIEA